jgi:glutamate-1-semialdehyde aminotransferase
MLEKYNTTNAKSLDSYSGNAPKQIIRGKGVYLYDCDDNKFLDFGMALGCVSIGYSREEIDDYVIEAIRNGINFSRPSFLEEELSNLILQDFTSKDYIIRYSKSSSMLLSVIPRICRHITKKSYIAYPKGTYLGNTDWYLSRCSNNSGIIDAVKEMTLVFNAGNIEELENLFKKYGERLACVIMEPFRNEIFPSSYYYSLKQLCEKYGVILVFDETVSGYRFYYPLAQYKIKCMADITVIGKAVSNGYSLSAAILKKELMELDTSKIYTFSTTHAGETTGLSAAIATIKFYKNESLLSKINQKGEFLLKQIKEIIQQQKLDKYITVLGMPTYFKIQLNNFALKNMFCSLFFENKMLCRGVVSVCYMHSYDNLENFIHVFRIFCSKIKGDLS